MRVREEEAALLGEERSTGGATGFIEPSASPFYARCSYFPRAPPASFFFFYKQHFLATACCDGGVDADAGTEGGMRALGMI